VYVVTVVIDYPSANSFLQLGLAHTDVTGLLGTQSALLAATEGMDVHLSQLSQRVEDVEDRQERQAVDLEEGRCRCGTLVESAPVTRSPGSLFEGFEGPRSGAITDSDEEVLPVPTIAEMRVWAGVREPEPEASHSSSEVEALDWVDRHPMRSPSPGWDADDIDASLAAFPELL
jgi:hypothetical protein